MTVAPRKHYQDLSEMFGAIFSHLPANLTRERLRHVWYAPVLVFAMGLMFIRQLVYARLLDVPAFAQYSAGMLVSGSFVMLGCLGLQSLLQRELPGMIVRRRESAGGIILMQCALVAIACAALSAGVVFVVGVTLAGLSPALAVLSLTHGLSMQFFLLATIESRSRGHTLRFARQNLDRAVVMLLAGSATAAFIGNAAAVLTTEAVSSLVLSAGLLRGQFVAIPMRLATAVGLAWRRLLLIAWRSPLTLLAVSFINFMVVNADRWIASELLIVSAFAHYAFAWTVLSVAQSLQLVINSSLFPLLARRFASHGAVPAFYLSAAVSLGMLGFGILAVLPVCLVLNYSVERWFPGYREVLHLLPTFLVISVLRLSDFWSSYLVVIGRETQLLVLNFFSLVLAISTWCFFRRPYGESVAISQLSLVSLFLTITAYVSAAGAAWHYSGTLRRSLA